MTLYSSIYTVVKPLLQILCSTKSSTIPLRTRSWGGLGYIGFECNFRCPVRLGYARPLAATLKKDTSFSQTLSQYFKSHASALDTPWPPECTCCLESLLCNVTTTHGEWLEEESEALWMISFEISINTPCELCYCFFPQTIIFTSLQNLVFYSIGAKLYAGCVCATIGTTEHRRNIKLL